MEDLQFLYVVVPLVVVMPYVLGPLLLKVNHKEAVQPVLHVLSETDVPVGAQQYFMSLRESLVSLGFVRQATLLLQHPTGGSRGYLELWLNRAEGSTVTPVVSYAVTPHGTRVAARMTSFVTRFGPEAVLETTNNATPLIHPPPAGSWSFAFPQVSDVAQLWRLHRALVRRHAPGPGRFLPPEGQNVAYLAGRLAEVHRRHAESGLYQLAPDGQHYRLTWGAACRLAWTHAWPVLSIRKSAHRRRGVALAKELEREGLD